VWIKPLEFPLWQRKCRGTRQGINQKIAKFFIFHFSLMSLSSLIDKYAFYLQYEKNASPKTLENYMLWLNRLVNFVGDMPIGDLKAMHVLDYRMYLHQLELSKKTINYHIVAIRAFLKFCLKNDIDCLNPNKLELAKVSPREINYLDDDEIDKILEAPILKYGKNTLKVARDEAILRFLYGTGLRVSELINLKLEQIKADSKQFSVIGKGSKMRSVFMTTKARTKLEAYLKLRDDDSEYLFINLSHNGFWNLLSRNAVEELVRNYAVYVGIDKKVTPHTLRHSFATSLLKKWADIRAMQILLGHASITTTQIYTHVDDKHLQKVHDLLEI